MTILYLAFIRLPTEKAHGAQIMKTCEALAGEGARVELAVPGRKTHITEDPFEYYGVQKNFTLTVLNAPDFISWGRPGFVFSALWFSEKARWRRSFWEADVIYSRDAFVLLQYLLLGRTLVYEAHTRPTVISLFVARRARSLVVISEGLRDAYVRAGIPAGRILVAHDAIDPIPFEKQYDRNEARAWLDIPHDKKIALYVGRIDEAKGADIFAAASAYMPADTLCVLIGSGRLAESLRQEYPKALFLSETPYKELPRVLSAADVLVLPNSARDEDASRYTSPLKAFAYLASGKPIVASDVPALRAIFSGKDAFFFRADDATHLASVIRRVCEDSEDHGRHNEIGLNAPREMRQYTWGARAKRILGFLSQHQSAHGD